MHKKRSWRGLVLLSLGLTLTVALAGVALGHDCSGPGDCEQTAGYNAVIAIIGGLIGILVSILGPLISSMVGQTTVGPIPVPGPIPPDRGEDWGAEEKAARDEAKAARDEADAYKKQWEEAKKGLDPNDPGYLKLKEQYDNYIKYNEDKAAAAEAQIKQIQDAKEQENVAAAQQKEWISGRQDDLKAALEERAHLEAVMKGAASAGFNTDAHQIRLNQLNERVNELHGSLSQVGGDIVYIPADRGVIAPGQEFVKIRDDAKAQEEQRILEENRRLEMEQLKAQQEKLEAAMKDAASWKAHLGEMLSTGVGGTAERVGNVLSLGVYDAVKDNWGKGASAVAGAVATTLGDIVTIGFVSGYQRGGIAGGLSNMAYTALPINEVGALTTGWSSTTWDQKMGALGCGILKTLTLGRAGAKLIGTQPLTAAEIQAIKYGYHYTKPTNILSIQKTGLQSFEAKGAISSIASWYKQTFKTGEPPKAAYTFGKTKPGWGSLGSINTDVPPLTIDLTKVDPSKLIKRPIDGAIIYTGDKIPPSAIKWTSWKSIPESPTPYRGNWSTVPPAILETWGAGVIDKATQQIL